MKKINISLINLNFLHKKLGNKHFHSLINTNNKLLVLHNDKSIFNLQKKYFARNISGKKPVNDIPSLENNIEDLEEGEQEGVEKQPISNMTELDKTIDNLYKRGKIYKIELNKVPFEQMEDYYESYQYIITNIKQIKGESLDKLVKCICAFGINDNKTVEILHKVLNEYSNKFKAASLVLYTLAKLDFHHEILIKNSMKHLEETDLSKVSKEDIILLIHGISHLGLKSKPTLLTKIDDFISDNIHKLNEFEVSIIFSFYSKLNYLNYDQLEVIIKKCLEFVPKMSLRYLVIIAQCLNELNIRNTNLLTSIKDRFDEIIDLNKKNKQSKDEKNKLTADSISLMINNLVKSDFIEFPVFQKYEDLFFDCIEKEGLLATDTLLTILASHITFMKKIINEIKNKAQRVPIKTSKAYKELNEVFFENYTPYLNKYQENISFKSGAMIFYSVKISGLSKRKIIRDLSSTYMYLLEKYLDEENIKEHHSSTIDQFIESGLALYKGEYETKIIEKLKEYKIDVEQYKIKSKEKKEKTGDNDEVEQLENKI